ncbi:MAG: glycosyltransferase family 2 protein [Syntrophobacteraceae bacterium]
MLTLVVPVYRNEESLPELLDVIDGLSAGLNGELETVFVIDGSPDRCYEILRDTLPTRSIRAKLVLLSRNFGSFAAIRAGMEIGEGDRYAVMAADLQEPPDLILEMDSALRTGDCDVVVGVREAREDPLMSRVPSNIFWGLYRRFVVPGIPPGGVDVFACTRAFRDQLLQMEERHSSLIAQIFWLGYRRRFIGYARQRRKHGKSAWTWRKKVNYLLDSVFSFTDLPIQFLINIGAAGVILSGLFGTLVAILRLTGRIDVPGYAATILVVVFLGALNLVAVGIVGSYAWRTYENTKARPLHVVLRSHAFEPKREIVDLGF